jgi:poly(hydroxyalkanoate) depolymerase family esterase
MLARLRRQAKAAPPLSGGRERWLTETAAFGANPGALRMLSYAPEDLPAGAPLVVVLHGCTQQAEAHAEAGGWRALADRHGFAVVAPEQTTANNSNRCFNWFEPGDAARGKGEAQSIRSMVAHAVRAHGLDPARIYVTGLSAGGAMTSVMLAAYPDVFAAGAIVAGLPYGVADNLQQALGAMFGRGGRTADDLGGLVRRAAPAGKRIPRVAIWHGDADSTVQPHNAVDIARQWAAVHGLPDQPTATEALPGRTRAVWRAADGEVLIESNLIRGFGHGTPLETGGVDGVGSVAPYMLEAGVSSSREIVRFWGIDTVAKAARPRVAPKPAANDAGPVERPQRARAETLKRPAPRGMIDVQGVIESALKTAGLMK